jgi:type II secretory pathway pseudopilin PulG
MKPRSSGLTTLEFAVVLAVFVVLAGALMVRLNSIQEEAERTEVSLTIRNIRVGIQLAIGERIMRGEEERISEVAQASPIDFLGHLPRDFNPGSFPEAPGQWAYDPLRRELTYWPRLSGAFAVATELRWRYVARLDPAGRTVGISLIGLN